jgi:pimeloyl-ACP methyl ester carboxylesterase
MRSGWIGAALAFALAGSPLAEAVDGQGYAFYAKTQDVVALPGGRTIHLACIGKGAPTVIFSAGMADWSGDWRFVQPIIAKTTRTCAWDRAGNGLSGPSPDVQDVIHTEGDLEAVLRAAGEKGPFVMVGHSLGAFDSLRFTDRNRAAVVGMVLVDPSFPDMERLMTRAAPATMGFFNQDIDREMVRVRRCIDDLNAGRASRDAFRTMCTINGQGFPSNLTDAFSRLEQDPRQWRTYLSNLGQMRRTARLMIDRNRKYGSLPLVVLSAGRLPLPPNLPGNVALGVPSVERQILAGHQALARLSSSGTQSVVADAAHDIEHDDPDAVVKAIDEVVEKVRRSQASIGESSVGADPLPILSRRWATRAETRQNRTLDPLQGAFIH